MKWRQACCLRGECVLADALLEMAASEGSAEDVLVSLKSLFPDARGSQSRNMPFRLLVKELFPKRDLHEVCHFPPFAEVFA